MKLIKELFTGTEGFMEIREISPQGRVKQLFIKPQEIGSYKPSPDTNIYYGVFNRAKKSGKAVDCTTTKTVWADYDEMENLAVDQRIKEVSRRLLAASIPEPSAMVSSGNGIHAYWLLTERVGKEVVTVNRAIARLTDGDMKATDQARILRLPNTNNVKDLNNIKRCEVVQANYDKLYDLEEIKKAIGVITKPMEVEQVQANTGARSSILDSIKPDRPCIAAILKGVPEGERNFTLGRLTKWLQIKGYTKVKAREIITEWNRYNIPPENKDKLESDFYQYWKGDYKLLGCGNNNPELQQILYKYCNRPECKFIMAIGSIKLDNSISYNNRVFNELYKLTGNDLIIYGLLVRHKEGLITSKLIEKLTVAATRKPCMNNTARTKAIGALRKKGFIEVTEGNARKGIDNLYKAIPQGTYGLGYTLVSNGAISGAINKQVTPQQLRLYVLLLKYAFSKGSCYPSLETLGKDLRNSPSNISKLLKGLESKDYIKRDYKINNGVESLDIRLLM